VAVTVVTFEAGTVDGVCAQYARVTRANFLATEWTSSSALIVTFSVISQPSAEKSGTGLFQKVASPRTLPLNGTGLAEPACSQGGGLFDTTGLAGSHEE
jgi:hypothetical protein